MLFLSNNIKIFSVHKGNVPENLYNHPSKILFNEHISDWIYWIALKLDHLIFLFENTAVTAQLNIIEYPKTKNKVSAKFTMGSNASCEVCLCGDGSCRAVVRKTITQQDMTRDLPNITVCRSELTIEIGEYNFIYELKSTVIVLPIQSIDRNMVD